MMKRRSFLGRLAALIAAPAALDALEAQAPAETGYNKPVAGLVPIREVITVGRPSPAEICIRFARRYGLELEVAGNPQASQTGRFYGYFKRQAPAAVGFWDGYLPEPIGPVYTEASFTANLRPWGAGSTPGMLERQLMYQYGKALEMAGLSDREILLVIDRRSGGRSKA